MQQNTATPEPQASLSPGPSAPEKARPPQPDLDSSCSQQTHLRQESSTSDEFGSFVYVPTSDDPLGIESANLGPTSPITSSISDVFADDVKQRSKENEKRVLDDLREHEEDPLAWLGTSVNGSGSASSSCFLSSKSIVDLQRMLMYN